MQTERSFIAVTSIALAIACGSDDREARQATAEYFDALRTGRWEAAWAMVTATDREALPLSGFVDYSQEEAQRHAKTSSTIVSVNISGSTARVAADVTTPDESSSGATRTDRETTNLVKENGAWKIDTDWSEEKAKTDLANKAQATFGEALLRLSSIVSGCAAVERRSIGA